MNNAKPRIYLDAAPIIDLVKVKVGVGLDSEREKSAWHVQQMIRAAQAEHINLYTSGLSIAECTHVEDQNKLDQAKPFFMGLLASGKGGIVLVQPTLNILERARDLRWIHGVSLKGVDAIHVASALYFKCDELITLDGRIAKNGPILERFGIRVCHGLHTQSLPSQYRQAQLFENPGEQNSPTKN
ncbi:MAG: PIN domain-containing protein [Gammaproteobacteria bacterium]|nr:PIN domain-containing protein [Gammaproteobacteria bacterium]